MTMTRQRSPLHEQARALRNWIIGGEKRAIAELGFEFDGEELALPGQRDVRLSGRQSRADSANLETGGGYTIAAIFAAEIDVQLKFFAAIRQYATIVTTETGGPLVYPMVQDFDNEGVEVPENGQVSTTDIEQFGALKLFPHKIVSGFLLIPNELLEDVPLALVDFLARILGERCGRGANRRYTQYLTAQAPVAVTTASPTAIASDELISTFYSVDASYRDSATAGWLMHSTMIQYIRELKDSGGRYLYRKSKKSGSPDTLLGKPIIPNYAMPSSPTAATVSALFGDLAKILVRDVKGVRIKRAEERWADSDQVGIAGYLRTSAGLLDIGGKPVQSLMQHS